MTIQGTIVRLVLDKGFGFIARPDGSEYFFHRSSLRGETSFDDLREHQTVEFDAGQSAKGLRAENVVPHD
jgi:CspA family cold shock protein